MTDAPIRLAAFAGTFLAMFLLESLLPRRERVENRIRRTIHNLLISFLNSAILRAIPLLSAMGTATYFELHGWGWLNQFDLPIVVECVAVIIALDFVIYWQHVAAHRFPILWQFHKVHHADRDLDASSGLRFHPVEIVFSMLVKCVAVMAIGASPEGVLAFEIVLSSCAIFNHSNLALPNWMDRVTRFVVVTPDMHRIHHSVRYEESNSNYGFSTPLWDRLFRTYRSSPQDDHEQLPLGLPDGDAAVDSVGIWGMLRMPFTRPGKETVRRQ